MYDDDDDECLGSPIYLQYRRPESSRAAGFYTVLTGCVHIMHLNTQPQDDERRTTTTMTPTGFTDRDKEDSQPIPYTHKRLAGDLGVVMGNGRIGEDENIMRLLKESIVFRVTPSS